MANFEAYKENGQLGAPASQLTRVTYDNSGAQALAAQGARTAQGLSNLALAFERQHRTAKIMAADNEYNRLTGDLKQEIYQDKEGLAENALQRFEEGERKIRNQIAKKYGRILTYGDEGRNYQDILNRDYNNHRSQVAQFQINELEKNADTQLGNSLQDTLNDAMAGYQNQGTVDGMMNRAIAMVELRYQNYGTDRIKQKVRAVMGGMAQAVINKAYADGSDDLAETYIEKYGRVLDPNVLTNFAKATHERRLRMLNRSTAESLVAQYGDNIEALWKAIYEGTAAGSGFDGEKAVQWMADMAGRGENWGVNTCTKGVNAALEAAGGIPGNTWAPTNYEDAKASGVAFTDRGKLRTGDIVYWDSDEDGKAGHVGIYDAKSGKVYQSGTHGFAAISLDTYGVIGFARPQGRGMTLEQKDELYNTCVAKIRQNKALHNYRISNSFKVIDQQLMAMYDSGDTDLDHYYALIDKTAGADPDLREKGYRQAHYWWSQCVGRDKAQNDGSGTGSGGSKGGLALGMEHGIVQTLMHRDFANEAEYAAWLVSMSPSKAEYERLIKLYDAKKNGTGVFKFDWSGLEASFKEKYPDMDKAMEAEAWRGAQAYAIQRINDVRNGGTEPTLQDVVGFVDEAMTRVNYGSYKVPGFLYSDTVDVNLSKAELAAAHIISTRRLPGTDQFEVLKDDGVTHIVDAEGLKHLLAPNVGRTNDPFTN